MNSVAFTMIVFLSPLAFGFIVGVVASRRACRKYPLKRRYIVTHAVVSSVLHIVVGFALLLLFFTTAPGSFFMPAEWACGSGIAYLLFASLFPLAAARRASVRAAQSIETQGAADACVRQSESPPTTP